MNNPSSFTASRVGRALVALLCAGGASAALAAPPRLVGQPINNDRRVEAALEKAVDCQVRASDPVRYEGMLRNTPFIFLGLSCAYVGGNSQWTALMLGFHDGKRFTRVLTFSGVPAVESGIAVRGDRLVYRAAVSKPGDARCCPTGKAIVEIDPDRMVAVTRALGFAMQLAPARGQLMK